MLTIWGWGLEKWFCNECKKKRKGNECSYRQWGRVSWFDESKGFGFITPDQTGGHVFVHYTAIKTSGFRTLSEGQRVTFILGRDGKSLCVEEVMSEY